MIVIDKDGKYLIANESTSVEKAKGQETFGLQDRTVVPPVFKTIEKTGMLV